MIFKAFLSAVVLKYLSLRVASDFERKYSQNINLNGLRGAVALEFP